MGSQKYKKNNWMVRSFVLPLCSCIFHISFAFALDPEGETSDEKIIEEVVEQLEYEDSDFFSESSMSWVESKRIGVSGDIVAIGEYIDSLMGDVDAIADQNRSYVKLYIGALNSKLEGVEELHKINFRLDLPLTKRRFRLILESDHEDEDDDSYYEETRPGSNADEDFIEQAVNASVRFMFESRKWERLSFDWGIKARLEPDIFSRARGVRRWEISDRWSLTFFPELFWFESKGAGAQTAFNFDRLVSSNLLFRFRPSTTWYERDSSIIYHTQMSLYRDISKYRAIEYSIGAEAINSDSHTIISEYFSQIRYRRNLYKGWLFYQVSMGTAFPRDFDYRVNPFIGFRLEILLSDDLEKSLKTRLH